MKKNFLFWSNWYDAIQAAPEDLRLACFQAICEYGLKGELYQGDNQIIIVIMAMVTPLIDEKAQRYQERCDTNKRIAKEREERRRQEHEALSNVTNGDESSRNVTDIDIELDIDKDILYNGIGEPIPKPKKKRDVFVKPTKEEVQEYCNEKNFNICVDDFMDFYDSIGWKVGRNPMKDWKKTVNLWSRREKNQRSTNSVTPVATSYKDLL